MESQSKFEMQSVEQAELQAVSGGYIPMIDVSGMPDRSEQCGTMWYLEQLSKLFRPTRFPY
jgi:hypothetical protein